MTPQPRTALGPNVFYLGYYVKKKLASNDKLLAHGRRAYLFQDQIIQDVLACDEKGICYSCGMPFVVDEEDK